MVVSQFLANSARKFPSKIALVAGSVRHSYQEIYRSAYNLAGYLATKGLKKGDRVAVYLPNSANAVISIFGILEAGGCFVVINPTIKEPKLRHILSNSESKFIITDITRKELVQKVAGSLEHQLFSVYTGDNGSLEAFENIITQNPVNSWPEPIDVDLAAIIYTSGSTGEPKGVTMTHRNVISASSSITTYLENVPEDIILSMLPLSFDYGLYQVIMAFHIGATLILEPGFGYPGQIIKLIRDEKVTGLPGVPTLFAILFQMKSLEEQNLDSVKYISNTAAALPPAFSQRLKKCFPRAKVYSMYGLTECKRVSYLPPELIEIKPDSVGIPMPNTEVWIVDENDNELPPGKVGQLVVRGGSVMREYWRDQEATSKVLRPGRYPWEKVLYTGDLFKMDEDGHLYFVGRVDDIIKCRGERVSPKEIENTLYGMEEILNARVIGVPDPIFGQAIKAEIVLKEGYDIDNRRIKAYCRKNLEDLMVPQIIEFVKDLPISTSGKIKRRD
jgi:amino acid adenylation domain-containing protein